MKLVLFKRASTVVIFLIIKDYLGGISRNLESKLFKNKKKIYVKIEKNKLFSEQHPFIDGMGTCN